MLLELCDVLLKDWLTNLQSISWDETENFLAFAQDIARGVEHLHSCNPKVVRRYGGGRHISVLFRRTVQSLIDLWKGRWFDCKSLSMANPDTRTE